MSEDFHGLILYQSYKSTPYYISLPARQCYLPRLCRGLRPQHIRWGPVLGLYPLHFLPAHHRVVLHIYVAPTFTSDSAVATPSRTSLRPNETCHKTPGAFKNQRDGYTINTTHPRPIGVTPINSFSVTPHLEELSTPLKHRLHIMRTVKNK